MMHGFMFKRTEVR